MKKWLSTLLLFAGMLLALHPIRASAAAATTVTIGGITVSDGDYLAPDLSPISHSGLRDQVPSAEMYRSTAV